MKLTYKDLAAPLAKTPFLVLLGLEGRAADLPRGVDVPKALLEDFKGEFRQIRLGYAVGGPAERVLLVGLGKAGEVDAERVRRALALAVQQAEAHKVEAASALLEESLAGLVGGPEALGAAAAEGAVMGAYRYDGGKSQRKPKKLARLTLIGPGAGFRHGGERGEALGEANCFARDLQNKGGNQMTPSGLASAARALAAKSPRITCKVLDEAAMEKLGMGLLLGVSQGSRQPAKLIHLVYKPTGRSKGRIAFVGKGLTFDAGGISLKPGAKMDEMRYDMSGGAAVLGVFHALAALDVSYEVHGIVPASENLPDGQATKPGDVHTALNGKTVEILNTDAEGRLILGDALAYTVSKVKPDTVIDLATLTGAVVIGLGHEVSGLFASSDSLRDELVAAGGDVGERVWPLPLLDEFKRNLEDGPADLRNICSADMGGGSIAGAAFLSFFVGDTEWAHLDIAGTAWGTKGRDYVGGSGGTGVGVRLLLRYLERKR